MITDFFHRLFNPTCEHCIAKDEARMERERLERACPTCDVLRLELEKAQRREHLLLEKVMAAPPSEPVHSVQLDEQGKMPVLVPKSRLWRQTQQDLERQSQVAAEKIRKDKIEELESIVLPEVSDATK